MNYLTEETNREIEAYHEAQEKVAEFNSRILKMIRETFDPKAHSIEFIDFDDSLGYEDNLVHVVYDLDDSYYGCETVCFPFSWLNKDFDYKTDYKRIQEIKKRKHEKWVENWRKNYSIEAQNARATEREERAEYERLKKYESE